MRVSVRMVLVVLDTSDVKVVDVEMMMMNELSSGRMGDKSEARHLM